MTVALVWWPIPEGVCRKITRNQKTLIEAGDDCYGPDRVSHRLTRWYGVGPAGQNGRNAPREQQVKARIGTQRHAARRAFNPLVPGSSPGWPTNRNLDTAVVCGDIGTLVVGCIGYCDIPLMHLPMHPASGDVGPAVAVGRELRRANSPTLNAPATCDGEPSMRKTSMAREIITED